MTPYCLLNRKLGGPKECRKFDEKYFLPLSGIESDFSVIHLVRQPVHRLWYHASDLSRLQCYGVVHKCRLSTSVVLDNGR